MDVKTLSAKVRRGLLMTPAEKQARTDSVLAMRAAGRTLKQIAAALDLSRDSICGIIGRQKYLAGMPRAERAKEELRRKLGGRVYYWLEHHQLETPEQIAGLSAKDIIGPNLGRVSLAKIEAYLAEHGLALQADPAPADDPDLIRLQEEIRQTRRKLNELLVEKKQVLRARHPASHQAGEGRRQAQHRRHGVISA